jgi:hypothetical protein
MKQIQLAIAVVSSERYCERRKRCRRLWTHGVCGRADVVLRFFVGGGVDGTCVSDSEPDTVALACADDYPHLPQKTMHVLRWFLEHYEFEYLFKCDDDTYVRPERLLGALPPAHEYCGWGVNRSFADAPEVASGGAGYLLSRRAARLAAEGLASRPTGAEDDLVGRVLGAVGIRLHHDPRFRWNVEPSSVPAPDNDIISAHWVNDERTEELVRRPWLPVRATGAKERDLVLRIGSRTIRWIIEPEHDRLFTERVLLPWAAPQAVRLDYDAAADFTVGVYLTSGDDVQRVVNSPGVKFFLCGEPEQRYPTAPGCYQIVQDPRDGDGESVRYGPILCLWSKPIERPTKCHPCSAIEGKGRPARLEKLRRLKERIGRVDEYGAACGRPLGGYHCVGPESSVFSKHEGLSEYGFSAAIERVVAGDYLTEKFSDPIMCETVPLYSGCPNINLYAVEGSYHLLDAADDIPWTDWRTEYVRRRPAVLRQKELIRSHFNVLSYFIQLTGHLEWLDAKRPITLDTVKSG